MMDEYDDRVPSPLLRFLGIMAAAFLFLYGAVGVLHNDLKVTHSKSGPGVHLHGPLAWVCFAGMVMMSIGFVRFLAPGDGKFDFSARRRRFGPLVLVGLVLYLAAQAIAGLRS